MVTELLKNFTISLIAARAKNHAIGRDGRLPWGRIPEDLEWFKEKTIHKPVIMGRKTWESLGNPPFAEQPLPERKNIVMTRNTAYMAEGAELVHSLEDALASAGECDEVMIVGGEQIYRLTLPMADRVYLTEIDESFEGDAFFPKLDMGMWKEESRSDTCHTDEGLAYQFVVYERLAII